MPVRKKLTIGLALGSGAAHGLAHVGVLRALEEMDIRPDVLAGTSIGAIVGASQLTGQIDDFLSYIRSMNLVGVMGLLDLTFSRGGLIASEKIFDRFRPEGAALELGELPIPFGAVATDLADGREIWLRDGDLYQVLRATSAIPGLFPPVAVGEDWLVDGALVNPVPVSLCRAMGANFVIAVGLSMNRTILPPVSSPEGSDSTAQVQEPAPSRSLAWHERVGAIISAKTRSLGGSLFPVKPDVPSAVETLLGSIDVMQGRIMRSRLAGDPPEILITPRLGQIGMLDFDRVDELIAIGYEAVTDMRPAIAHALGQAGPELL